MVVVLVVQPVAAGASATVVGLMNAAFGLVYLGVLFVVFAGHRHRAVALALYVSAIVANFILYAVPENLQVAAGAVFHCTALAFLGYTITAILRDLFSRSVIQSDDVFGAAAGYLLGGLAWAHLYALAYLMKPQAFGMSHAILAQLGDPRLRQELFNYFSFTTLTSIGFSDVTPVGPMVYSLVWLEVMFGRFYMAVVVAQIVGLKLAQALARRDDRRP